MKAKAFRMAIIAGLVSTAGFASATPSANERVSIGDVKLIEEQVIENRDDIKANNWERRERREGWGRERRWERREGWGWGNRS